MRILVAHNVPRARTGGMSRLMAFIHDHIESAGHDVDYLCADDVPDSGGWWGRRVAFPMAVRARAIAAERAGRPYDVVNVHEPIAAPLLLRRRAHSASVVVTSHGLERRAWELAKEEGRLGREAPGWRTRVTYPPTALWPGEFALRRADHVFCLNDEDKQILVTDFDRQPATITKVTPGADPIYATAAERRDYSRATRIMFAGTWRKNKGIEDLVPAFATFAERHADVILHVVGAGASPEFVRAQFPEQLHSRIDCHTPGDEVGMAQAFAAADIFLLPSLFEGTPLTLIQAMLSGLPIVTTPTCGMKDVITDECTGLFVPIRSSSSIVRALERLKTERALRECLGRAARTQSITNYSWERSAEPVLRAYEGLR
ncbi:MAG TPA: glycosyltransferase family 4 protein [Vicinamibacterales bacterium]